MQEATGLREFGPRGLLAVLVIVVAALAGAVVGAVAVLLWAHLSRTPLRDLGFEAASDWFRVLVAGIALGVALKLALKAVVMPLLGAPAVNMQYQQLAGDAAALPGIIAVVVLAGVAEELLYRGYVFERLHALLGSGRAVLWTAVLVSTSLFALAHYRDQGLPGVAQSAVTGLAFAGLFAWRRQLWLPIIAHIAFNLTSVALIYASWEAAVAGALLRN